MVRSWTVFSVAIVLMAASSKTQQFDMNNCVLGKNDEKVCTDIPSDYNKFEDAMNALLRKDFELMNSWHGEDLEDEEYNDTGSEFNCESVTEVRMPYVLDKNNNKKLIVQTEIFKQKIQTTKCVEPNNNETESEKGECFKPLASGWKGQCKTKYAAIDLVLYDIEKQEIEKISVELPVCCYCSISDLKHEINVIKLLSLPIVFE